MSEVQIYTYEVEDGVFAECVLMADYDAQRLRADTAEAELKSIRSMACMLEDREWAEHAGNGPTAEKMESAITELHNELAAAEQRIAELKGLILDLTLDDDFPEHWNEAYAIDAALNPNPEAESHE